MRMQTNVRIHIKSELLNHISNTPVFKNKKVLVEMSYNDYIDTVQKTAGIMLKAFGNSILTKKNSQIVKKIIEHYENHSSISKIREN